MHTWSSRKIFQDWEVNTTTSLKSRLVMALFRLNHAIASIHYIGRFIVLPVRALYQIVVEWILGIEIPWDTKIGSFLKLQHSHGIVIHHHTVIGHNCVIRHTTTIGNKQYADGKLSGPPHIGNYVDIGCHVVILGDISIGDRAVIGAGSVVLHDVPAGAVVVGNPGRVIRVNPIHEFEQNDGDFTISDRHIQSELLSQ